MGVMTAVPAVASDSELTRCLRRGLVKTVVTRHDETYAGDDALQLHAITSTFSGVVDTTDTHIAGRTNYAS